MSLPALGRLSYPVLAVSGLLLALAVFGAAHVRHLQVRSASVLDESIHAARVAEQLDFQVEDFRHRLSPDLWQQTLSQPQAVPEFRGQVEQWLSRADLAARTEGERELLKRIHQGVSSLERELDQAQQMPQTAEQEDRVMVITETTLDLEILHPAQEFLSQVQVRLEAAHQENQRQSRRLVQSLLFLGIMGAVAGAAAGYGVARSVRQSILQLSIPIQDVAGKLNEVVGPLNVSTDMRLEELGPVLRRVSQEVTSVVEKLHASHQEVARAEQLAALGQLAAGMAHEIRNPLLCIKTLVQVAESSPDATLDRRDLQVLDEEITRLEELLQEFLDFAQPGRFARVPVEFRQILENTVAFLQPRAERRSVVLHCDLPEEPVMLVADANRLRQVLLNLLLNALDAGPSGGDIQITLTLARNPQGGRCCELRVADEGPGVPQELRSRIFEPFYSTKETGLGLGLPICRRVVEAHGGTISVEEQPRGGTVFLTVLPLAELDAGEPSARSQLRSTGA